jgi:O-antigen ligase
MHDITTYNKGVPLPRWFSRWLLAHDDRRSEIYTYVCFASPPILGTVATIAVIVGGVGGIVEISKGLMPVSRDRFLLYATVPIYLYCASYLVALVANPMPEWKAVAPVVPFLLFPFLYSSWCLSKKETIARSVITASMIACYGALALAVFQFHFYGMRAEGGAGNAIVFATVTCMAAAVALAGAFIREGKAAVPLFGAYCAGSIAVLYSGSRMTWLALFLSTAAILWIYRERRHALGSALAVSCAALAVAVVTFAGTQIIPSRVEALARDWRQMSEHGNYDTSLGRRAELWRIGVAAVRENPIVGHGPQSTKPLIRDGFKKIGMGVGYSHFHNGFLNAWVEAGIVGILSLAAIFVVAGYLAIRTLATTTAAEARLGAVMLIALVTTYVVTGLVGIMVGHDILDAMLIAFLAVGIYLASGTSMLREEATGAGLSTDIRQ